jgi:peptide-methionine (S)-S-oxide reductase
MTTETATLAGGCFWCLEAAFSELRGVSAVQSGYTGGHVENPSYRQVCTGSTGHAEAVQITFDPEVISYADLLRVFYTIHDPTTLNRQGGDVGTQYRSAIYTVGEAQLQTANAVTEEFAKIWPNPIVTEITRSTITTLPVTLMPAIARRWWRRRWRRFARSLARSCAARRPEGLPILAPVDPGPAHAAGESSLLIFRPGDATAIPGNDGVPHYDPAGAAGSRAEIRVEFRAFFQ